MRILSKIRRVIKKPSLLFLFVLDKTAGLFPDKLFLELKFRLMMGQKLDLKNPKTFNEKLQWLKLYNRKLEYTTMVNKYAVKQYVADKIGEEYIIPTLGVWDKPEDIDWNTLPNQFVLKTTHGGGGGGVVICKDKSTFDINNAIKQLTMSLKQDIFLSLREWPYKDVPKRIIAEQYITDGGNEMKEDELKDYKFFCFNGNPYCLKIDFARFTGHRANYYDMDMNILPLGEECCLPDFNRKFEKPINFEKMIDIVRKLSEKIPFSRIDLYNSNGKIYFGEITFFPAGGMGKFVPDEWDCTLGDLITLIE